MPRTDICNPEFEITSGTGRCRICPSIAARPIPINKLGQHAECQAHKRHQEIRKASALKSSTLKANTLKASTSNSPNATPPNTTTPNATTPNTTATPTAITPDTATPDTSHSCGPPGSNLSEAIPVESTDTDTAFTDHGDLHAFVADLDSCSDNSSSTGEAPAQEHWDFDLHEDPFDCDSGVYYLLHPYAVGWKTN